MNILRMVHHSGVELFWRGIVKNLPNGTISALARLLFSKSWAKFERAARNPRRAQEKRLAEILERNRDTEIGRQYDFSSIRSIEDYQERLPIFSYDDLAPQIARMAAGEKAVLTADEVYFFALTSGTTSAAKYIPITRPFIAEHRHVLRVWSRQLVQAFPGLVRGTILSIQSPAIEEHTKSGVPCGSITAIIDSDQARTTGRINLLKPLQKIPSDIFLEPDYDTRYYLILRCAVAADVSLMSTVNPSTLLMLCQKLSDFAPQLIEDSRRGTLRADLDIPLKLRRRLEEMFKPDDRVADRIEDSLLRHGRVRPPDVWPDLCGLVCWKGGSSPFYLRQFPDWFGDLPVMDFGYAATEGRFSVVMSPEGDAGVLALGGHFLEFIPESERGTENPQVLTADQLRPGERYFVLVTAANGLYRYDMNDVIEVDGYHHQTPLIRFCHKGGNMISYTGEKVGDSHAVNAVSRAEQETGVELSGFCLTARSSKDRPNFVFAVELREEYDPARLEAFLRAAEEGLCQANIEYRAKRSSQRLGAPELVTVRPGAFERWRREKLDEGSFDAHVKLPHVERDEAILERLGVVATLLMEKGHDDRE